MALKEHYLMTSLNEGLLNFLEDNCVQPRWACYLRGNMLFVYLCGGKVIRYDGTFILDNPYNGGFIITEKDIDINIIKQIYKKLLAKNQTSTICYEEELKNKYKITKKNKLSAKELSTIAKYEEAIKRNKQKPSSQKGSSSA